MYNIYYRLRSIYEEQTPKVVVLCTDVCYSKFSDETYLQAAIGDITDELIPLVRFHDNWKDLTPENLFEEHDYTWRDPNKGYMPITDVAACLRGEYMYYDGRTEPLPFLVGVYMERIADLCAEHGSELLLITVPASSSWNLTRHDGVQAFADAHGLPYIDYNMAENDPGIDWLFDTPDGGSHLNVLGSEKLTAALGPILWKTTTCPTTAASPALKPGTPTRPATPPRWTQPAPPPRRTPASSAPRWRKAASCQNKTENAPAVCGACLHGPGHLYRIGSGFRARSHQRVAHQRLPAGVDRIHRVLQRRGAALGRFFQPDAALLGADKMQRAVARRCVGALVRQRPRQHPGGRGLLFGVRAVCAACAV